jgi:starch synthase
MRIVLVSSEVAPFSKTGGLADVAGSLPAALARLGHRVSVITPWYRQAAERASSVRQRATLPVQMGAGTLEAGVLEGRLPGTGVPVFFIARRDLFDRRGIYGHDGGDYLDNLERFAFFCRAAGLAARELGLAPDVFHLNDWQTALLAAYLRHDWAGDRVLSRAATVFTIHNLGYQGLFPPWKMPCTGLAAGRFNWQELEFYGQINLLKGALVYSDALSTVSRRYAMEIQTFEGGYGLDGVLRERRDRLFGIVNGLDSAVWDPDLDPLLPARFAPDRMAGKAVCRRALCSALGLTGGRDAGRPVLGMVSRLAEQKGMDILLAALPGILDLDVNVAILGSGEKRFELALADLAVQHPGRLAVRLGHDERLAHLVEAGSDIYLMPSRYEPCGLNQMISLKYGAIPVVRETGGLADTIGDGVNGFTFMEYSPGALLVAVRRAVAAARDGAGWRRMVARAMREDWSWERSAREYARLYEVARSLRGLPPAGDPPARSRRRPAAAATQKKPRAAVRRRPRKKAVRRPKRAGNGGSRSKRSSRHGR